MLKLPWRDPPLTEQEEIDRFMLTFLDDGEVPFWSFGGDLQFWAASSFAHSLRSYAREQRLTWYVASMLPVAYSEQPLLANMLIAPHRSNACPTGRPYGHAAPRWQGTRSSGN
jgi:hypothetical protein